MMQLRQSRAAECRAAVDLVNQAAQKVIEALSSQIEVLKQQNSSLQEKLQASERLQQPLIDEDALCVRMHQQRMNFLQADLKSSQHEVETWKETLRDMLPSAKQELEWIEQSLTVFRPIPQGVITQKWLAAHKDWSQ